MHRIFRWLFLFCLFPCIAASQADSLQEVKGLPTKQIFDLMIDSRGFLWIGHDLGLSRFDGTSFTHFSSPKQNSLGLGDLLEDKQGRIWCRNFSSQIFYVEHEKMNLLAAYDYKNEPRFPRIVIIGDKLVASSAKGLFICNTTTMKASYLPCGGVSTTTLSSYRNTIIAFSIDNFKLYRYDPYGNGGPVELQFNYPAREAEDISLQPFGFNDTLYSFSPRTGNITKLLLNENRVTIAGKIKSKGFLNTINPSGRDTWIHTKEQSQVIGQPLPPITGYDISDIVVDREGNTWYSSFKYGLLVEYERHWKEFSIPGVATKEIVVQMVKNSQHLIVGTVSGRIFIVNSTTNRIVKSITLPADCGPLQSITAIDSSRVIIATALRIFMLQQDLLNLELVTKEGSYLSLKNAVSGDSSTFMATATGLFELKQNKDNNAGQSYSLHRISDKRCRWVEYKKSTKQLFVAFKDELAEVKENRIIPVEYKGERIPVVTMLLSGSKIYLSTYNNGMMQLDEAGIRKMNTLDKFKSGPVYRIKESTDTVWLLGAGFIVLFNPANNQVYENFIIPAFPNANIYDIALIQGQLVLLTSKGAFVLNDTRQAPSLTLTNCLMKVEINGKDTTVNGSLVLPYNKNSLDFFLAVPFYSNADQIYFKYRLAGSSDESWKISENGENKFRFLSLRPGNYVFEAVAVHPQFGNAEKPIVFPFTIRKAWYQTTLYRVLLILFIVGSILLLVIHFYKERLRIQKMDYEKKLAIFNERQRISAEIHDDIGAGLSGVRLLTELTGNKITNAGTKDDLDKIYSSITELSAKMKEVVWSLNTNNDSLENLLLYIQLQTMQMMENGPAKLLVSLPELIPALQLGSDKRTDIYLSVKEAVHNALKHSSADRIELRFLLEGDQLYITVRDNGKGLPLVEKTGNGMLNMRKRIARLKGTMTIKNQEGLTVEFSIPLT